jgi:hypothetical protein
MFDQRNNALGRATSGRYSWVDALKLRGIDTQAGAAEGARASWIGAAWLALGAGRSLPRDLVDPELHSIARYAALVIDGAILAAMVWLAWLLRRRQPRWGVMTVLVLLCLNILLELLSLRIGIFLIINGWLIYLTAHALRAAYRLAAYRRGDRVDNQAIADVFQ